jgi:hypothetical protein
MYHKNEIREYRIERLDKNKLKDIETLYKAVYGHEPEKNYFLKKYNTAYTGAQYIGYIAYNCENIPLAYFGVIPCFIQYNNKIVLCAQAVDAMTLSQYRYKGMFVELAKITFDLCKASGINFIFGFPNQNSYYGLVHKLKWKEMTEAMDCFMIPVNTFPVESLSQKFKWTKWIYKKYVKWVLRKYSLLQAGVSNSVIAEGFGGVHRDKQYLQYKSYGHAQVIKIGNAKLWIRIKNGLFIGDLNVAEHDFDTVIDAIKKIAKRLSITNISFQSSPGTALHTLFAGKYKPIPSFPILFLNFGADLPLDKLKFTFADIDIF